MLINIYKMQTKKKKELLKIVMKFIGKNNVTEKNTSCLSLIIYASKCLI